MPGDGHELISVDEAVKRFGRSRPVVFRWLRQGKLVRYRSEGDPRTLVDAEALAKLIEPQPQNSELPTA